MPVLAEDELPDPEARTEFVAISQHCVPEAPALPPDEPPEVLEPPVCANATPSDPTSRAVAAVIANFIGRFPV